MTINELVATFGKLRPNATFVSVKEYKNNYDEVSDFGIVFHVDYQKALKRSYDIVAALQTTDLLQKEARRIILSSLIERIECKIPIEERDDPYVHFKDGYGNFIKGIKAHKETHDLYMFGFIVSKKVIIPTSYKPVNSSKLTVVKDRMENLTPISKFRQFKLIPKSYREIKIESLIIK